MGGDKNVSLEAVLYSACARLKTGEQEERYDAMMARTLQSPVDTNGASPFVTRCAAQVNDEELLLS